MSHEDQHIQKLFSEKLANHELPVDPAVWQGVAQGNGASGAAGGAAAATGLSVAAKLAIVAAIVGVVLAGSWALTREENTSPTREEHIQEEELPVSPQDSLEEQVVQLPEEVIEEEVTAPSNRASNQPSSEQQSSCDADSTFLGPTGPRYRGLYARLPTTGESCRYGE